MPPARPAYRSFDAVVRERMVTIARETRRQTGYARPDPTGAASLPLAAHQEWRERQACQQRYEALVCERLAELWLDAVPRVQERIRRR